MAVSGNKITPLPLGPTPKQRKNRSQHRLEDNIFIPGYGKRASPFPVPGLLCGDEAFGINWIFDKGKLPQNFKDKIIESIKSMKEIPDPALETLNATDAKGFAKVINDKWFNKIFIQGE